MPALPPTETLAELLHRVFGHGEFRPHQQEVCEAATAGRDVLLVMPTGAGKSLCYQLPALARGRFAPTSHNRESPTTALVISPLIALMDDQAGKLSALGLRVAQVHSGRSREDSRQACRDYLDGTLDFLFIAPERMRVPGFPEMLAKRRPTLIAIDEAHCISAWGHDFRPDYRTLGQHLAVLRAAADGTGGRTPIMALTATATPTVQRDILHQLGLQEPAVFITGFRRSNLAVEVVELSKPQRAEYALKLLKNAAARPAIVYAGSRKQADEFAERMKAHFPVAAYHAGLDAATRARVQEEFMTGRLEVVVATVAFGMGVDKADVRTVVHVALPGSVEAFYQEIGRAGRDGLASRSVLLHGFADRRTQEFFLEKNYPPVGDLEQVAGVLGDEYTDVETLQRTLGKKKIAMAREDLERAIEKLQGVGVAEVDMSGQVRAGEVLIEAAAAKRGASKPAAWKAGYEAQVTARRSQIDSMIAFAEGHRCRMTALVEHFGDTTDRRGPCGLCDVCHPQGSMAGTGADGGHAPNAEECRELRAILAALDGRGQSTGKLFTGLRLRKDRDDFDTLLDGLARAGLITLTNDTFRSPEGRDITYKKATITHEGREPEDSTLATVWIRGGAGAGRAVKAGNTKAGRKAKAAAPSRAPSQGRGPESRKEASGALPRTERQQSLVGMAGSAVTPRPAAPTPVAVELDAEQAAREERLKQWRRETAQKDGLPSFFIFSDTVLRGIVLARPSTLSELGAVKGVGAEKLERFGAKVVELCR
jgi:ATP-dependent DNA helicase RecQ